MQKLQFADKQAVLRLFIDLGKCKTGQVSRVTDSWLKGVASWVRFPKSFECIGHF